MTTKCATCGLFYKTPSMHKLNCQNHFVCTTCFNLNDAIQCQQCNLNAVPAVEPLPSENVIYNYPIQGMMVYYDKKYNPEGQSEFSSLKNCHQRTAGWIMCNFLGLVFFFSGLAMAIRTSETGTGVVLTIIGLICMMVSIFFICKVRKIDKYYNSIEHANQDNFIYLKKKRRTISSVKSERIQHIELTGTNKNHIQH